MKIIKQHVAILICLFFLASSIFSAVLFISHLDHDCGEENCIVCLHLSNISNNLKFIGGSQAAAASFIFILLAFFISAKKTVKPLQNTLVYLKVQLNN